MKIAFLSSSRADFGIYLPLLKAMRKDPFFDVRMIVFGTHLSFFHGRTVDQVQAEGFVIDHMVENVMASDTAESISTSMAVAAIKFTSIWKQEKENYDLVFCLGDRYEMFSAVSAAVPYGIKFAHIHGGETTLGSIDNQFRHCLSIFSVLHFTATDLYAEKVEAIMGNSKNIYTVGALSLDNFNELDLLSEKDFFEKYKIDISIPTILVTYHPETTAGEANEIYVRELVTALNKFEDYQVVITMPNADAMGNLMRKTYIDFGTGRKNVFLIENFGTLGYFSCMRHSKLVVGNSSSGIIEAASLKKYVVNIGHRQKGRIFAANIIQANNESGSILESCRLALSKGDYDKENIYYKGGAAPQIIDVLKKWTP